ncbi:hypothetical protein JCM11251_007725 [Rhodosporidiobolus azoricus]
MQLDSSQPSPPLPSHSPAFDASSSQQATATTTMEQLPLVTITHSVAVQAVHRLFSNALTDTEARARYGCTAMTLHGHEYMFEIKFKGVISKKTGQMQASSLLEDACSMAITEVLDRKNLEDVAFFLNRPSTLENLALFAWRNVSIIMSPHPFDVIEVSVESEPCPRDSHPPGAGGAGSGGHGGTMSRTKVSFSGEMVNMSSSLNF